jgi:CHAT domain-containing protein
MAKCAIENEKAQLLDKHAKQLEVALKAANDRLAQAKIEHDKKLSSVLKEKETLIGTKQDSIQHLQGEVVKMKTSLQTRDKEIKENQTKINFLQVIMIVVESDFNIHNIQQFCTCTTPTRVTCKR